VAEVLLSLASSCGWDAGMDAESPVDEDLRKNPLARLGNLARLRRIWRSRET
jgi:hypothetical protein